MVLPQQLNFFRTQMNTVIRQTFTQQVDSGFPLLMGGALGSTFGATKVPIFFEDSHLIAVFKPAGILSQGDDTGRENLLDLIKNDLKIRYQKPGNVFLGLLHRLDRPVSGIILYAKTSKAASRISEQIRLHTFDKTYLAWVEGEWKTPKGTLKSMIQRENREPQQAELQYECISSEKDSSLLKIKLITGRKHQIRIQLAEAGHPIIGDKKYGAKTVLESDFIALQATEISFDHPITKERIKVAVPTQH